MPKSPRPSTHPVYVTMVHGTFARGAAWTREDSPLGQAVQSRLGGEVVIDSIQWSGDNTAEARLIAAHDIRTRLEETFSSHPDRKHFLIGHSHGGSAIAYALRDIKDLSRCTGAVLISAPFFAFRLKPSYSFAWSATICSAFLIATMIIGALLDVVIGRIWQPDSDLILPALPAILIFFLMIAAFCWISAVHGNDILKRAVFSAEELIKRYQTIEYNHPSTLVVFTTGDEVSWLLSAAQLFTWISGRLLAVASLPVLWFTNRIVRHSRVPLWALLFIVLTLCCALLSAVLGFYLSVGYVDDARQFLNPFSTQWSLEISSSSYWNAPLDAIFRVFLTVVVSLVLLAALCSTLFIFSGLFSIASLAACGVFAPVKALLIEASVEKVPHGKTAAIHVPWEMSAAALAAGSILDLSHSRGYQEPKTISQIANAIREMLRSCPQ